MWLAGGCHCGAVRFRVRVDEAEPVALDCNCSVCQKRHNLHYIVTEDRFELSSGRASLTEYTFGTHVAKHLFCSRCGVLAFYRPRSHPDQWDVNVRCLDEGHARFRVVPFDGQNWEDSVASIR